MPRKCRSTGRPPAYDAVILSEVLEHLTDPWALVRKLSPLVRPGGLLLASSPNVSPLVDHRGADPRPF